MHKNAYHPDWSEYRGGTPRAVGADVVDGQYSNLELSERHQLNKVSIPKRAGNTMLTVSADEISQDVHEIHTLGAQIKNGEVFTVSSGRQYEIHNGSFHPVSGPGTVDITSSEYNILITARKKSIEKAQKSLDILADEKGVLSAEQKQRTQSLLDIMKENGWVKNE